MMRLRELTPQNEISCISLRVKIKKNFPIFTKVMLLSSKQFNVHVQCITESHSGRNTYIQYLIKLFLDLFAHYTGCILERNVVYLIRGRMFFIAFFLLSALVQTRDRI